MTRHQQTTLWHQGRAVNIDAGIAPLIQRLWDHGWTTYSSCESYPCTRQMMFVIDIKDYPALCRALMKDHPPFAGPPVDRKLPPGDDLSYRIATSPRWEPTPHGYIPRQWDTTLLKHAKVENWMRVRFHPHDLPEVLRRLDRTAAERAQGEKSEPQK